jgi:uncharacterized RDD family membrane protein YckC
MGKFSAPGDRAHPGDIEAMETSRYRVVFTGKLRPGVGQEEVQGSLAATFRMDPAKIESIFTGGPVLIKRNVDYPTARRYERAFAAAGAICAIEPADIPVPSRETPPMPPRAAAELPPLPLGGFWSRPLAFGIDLLLLGVFGALLGAYRFDLLARMGGWGRLFGFGIALLYFGLLNSSLGNGQTLGKRLMKIRVVGRSGRPISVVRSFVRFTLLGAPFFLNGAALPVGFGVLPIAAAVVILGEGGALILLYLANRRTRQSLHDLLVGTFVVRAGAEPAFAAPPVRKGLYWLAGGWVAAVLVLAIAGPGLFFPKSYARLASLQQAIAAMPGTRDASVKIGKTWGAGGETTFLSVEVAVSDPSVTVADVASEIATFVMLRYPDFDRKDRLVVAVRYGYDIGIASSWRRYIFSHSPRQWRKRLQVKNL